jgi:ferredoxin
VRRPHQLIVNPIACDAHGICAELFPEMIQLDDWGYPVISAEPIPPELESHARRAVAACPTLALQIAGKSETPRRKVTD